MPDKRTDKQGYSTLNADEERDMGAKGGPTTSLGIADNAHGVSHPYDDDIQTQLAAKSTQNKTNGKPQKTNKK
jgi:hypothetical protein